MKMINNGSIGNCHFQEDIVSYIYGELNSVERREFGMHMADCAHCSDEFTAISDVSLSVSEWRREAFAHLSTPEIQIPYRSQQIDFESVGHSGYLEDLRRFLGNAYWQVAAAASLVVVLGIGIGLNNLFSSNDEQIVSNLSDAAVETAVEPAKVVQTEVPTFSKTLVPTESEKALQPKAANIKVRDYKPRTVQRLPKQKQVIAANNRLTGNQTTLSQDRKPPVLGVYEDTDDRSLRLTDLFDDGSGAS